MRDLAARKFSSGHGIKLSPKFVRIFLILVIAFGAFSFVRTKVFTQSEGIGGGSVILQNAPRGLTPVEVAESAGIANKGVNLATQKITLKDVKYGGRASGTATRSFGGGTYILSADVQVPVVNGVLYEVWLVGLDGSQRSVDYMTGTKGRYSLNLRDTDKFSKYGTIWVTLERTKEDNKPEEHVLEGTFK